MLLFNLSLDWLKYFSYIWLAFCLGVLAPFTYTTTYSPHQEIPAFHIALFEEPINPAVILNQTTPAIAQLFNHFTAQMAVILAQTPALHLAQLFLLDFSSGYLLPQSNNLHSLLLFTSFTLADNLIRYSFCLPPPFTPPRLRLSPA